MLPEIVVVAVIGLPVEHDERPAGLEIGLNLPEVFLFKGAILHPVTFFHTP
jgi:hypothetical protein